MKKIIIALTLASCAFSTFAAEQIKIGTEAAYAPFEFTNQHNQIVGFDVDLAHAICKKIDADCTFVNQSFDSLIPSLKFRRIDAVMAGLDITPERAKQVTFTQPYYDNSAIFITLKGKFTAITDLKGKRVGIQNGTTHQKYLLAKHPELTITSYDSYPNAVLDLKNGRIDAIFSDTAVANIMLSKDRSLTALGQKVTDHDYFGSGLAIAVRKGNTELASKLNHGLTAIKQDGTYEVIYKKWFKE